jgi:putative endonuclease
VLRNILNKVSLGKIGEKEAVRYLKKRGYRILDRNFRTPLGEIDIVAQDGNQLVFIEVKTRSSDAFGEPFEAVHKSKQRRLKRLALLYIKQRGKEDMPVRFDVVSVKIDNTREVNHIEGAFEV